jgi:peroxiredoxin
MKNLTSQPTDSPPAQSLPGGGAAKSPRIRPRKRFILVGCTLAVVLGVGLFTSLGTDGTSGPPQVGAQAPRFSLPQLGGPGTVGNEVGDGSPTVILFFANWCSICHGELPALAKVVTSQRHSVNSLRKIQVIGVDSLESAGSAESFVKSSGVTFPVGLDSDASVIAGKYDFRGPPYAVFIEPDGRIAAIKASALSPSVFIATEKQLVGR